MLTTAQKKELERKALDVLRTRDNQSSRDAGKKNLKIPRVV